MNDQLTILQANYKDLEAILALQKKCYVSEAELYDDYNIQPLTQTIQSIEEEYQNGTIFLVGRIDKRIVASVRGFTQGNTTYIGKLIVARDFQNRKIAQRLMNAIEQRLNECERFELFTGDKSNKNIYLYNKLGYSEYKRKLINDKLTLVFMHKQGH